MLARFRRHVDRVLHAAAADGGRFRDAGLALLWGGACYGLVMGSFGGLMPDRLLQLLYSSVKVPMLIVATTLLALPSFFVLNTIAGLRDDFVAAMRAIAITQGVVGIVLAALAPFTALWYLTSANYYEATTFNGAMFALASLTAQRTLRKRYAPLIARNPRHRTLLSVWVILYVFVGIQMGWTLRPFVGDPQTPPSFFRTESWGNAYVIVADIVWRVVAK
ncbi:hypothetical protein BH11PLA2_BH11PLA2_45110 [soil metagenome]